MCAILANFLYTNNDNSFGGARICTIVSKLRKVLIVFIVLVFTSTASLVKLFLPIQIAIAAPQSISPTATVSFTFDDGYTSNITQAAPTLASFGYSATSYITSGCVGMTTAPNACQANTDASYMSWAQIQQLQNSYGWEIGSHTVTHPYLATSDPDDQPLPITYSQMVQEVSESKAAFSSHGIDTKSFATPYGDYNPTTLATIAKYYSSQRGFGDTGYNIWPNSDYYIKVQQVQAGVSVSEVKQYIDQAITNNYWLVLVFHDIKTKPSRDPLDYEYGTRNLRSIAAYVNSKNVRVANVSDAIVSSNENLLFNSSFNSGISGGWWTNSPPNITVDRGFNGSYPDATSSIKLTSKSTASHLFSPLVSVDSDTNYMLKQFLDVQSIKGGEVTFYIDEYDSLGNWTSGQYKAGAKGVFAESINFSYKPSSSKVKKASLQVGTSANSGITAYLDNVQWFPLNSTQTTPPTNLMPGYSFDSGLSYGWATDNESGIVVDTLGNGSPENSDNSIKLISNQSGNIHLFSPKIAVDSLDSYSLTNYLNIVRIDAGEVGFYIDEYGSSGNWINGQYKGGLHSSGKIDASFNYTPSNSSVKSMSLQIIVTGDSSNIQAYFDNVRMYVQN